MSVISIFWSITLVSLANLATNPAARADEIRIDCATVTGRIRPLHGVNNGPLNFGETVDLSQQWRAIGIPLTRLHDSEWPNPDIVDMHAVFPDPNADPASPQSYRFARTDDYINAIVSAGSGIVYRLGESIEHTKRKYHVLPPEDCDKWSDACVGIIRHYNEGWANGFRHNIRYWEIWNEPENRPAMWTGSDDDYYRLYSTAARKIKARYGDVKVGGPSSGYPGEIVDDQWKATPFMAGFLAHCKQTGAPLDFFSWHTYTNDPLIYARKARAIRRWLDDNGFRDTEIHLNEWNYLPDNDWGPMLASGQGAERERWYERMGGAEGATFIAAVLIDLQDAPVDAANLYSGDSSPFGLFTRHGAPKQSYYAMKAFRMLLDTPRRLSVTSDAKTDTLACAGINDDATTMTVLVTRTQPGDGPVTVRIENRPTARPAKWTVYQLDDSHRLDVVDKGEAKQGELVISRQTRGPMLLVIRVTSSND